MILHTLIHHLPHPKSSGCRERISLPFNCSGAAQSTVECRVCEDIQWYSQRELQSHDSLLSTHWLNGESSEFKVQSSEYTCTTDIDQLTSSTVGLLPPMHPQQCTLLSCNREPFSRRQNVHHVKICTHMHTYTCMLSNYVTMQT